MNDTTPPAIELSVEQLRRLIEFTQVYGDDDLHLEEVQIPRHSSASLIIARPPDGGPEAYPEWLIDGSGQVLSDWRGD